MKLPAHFNFNQKALSRLAKSQVLLAVVMVLVVNALLATTNPLGKYDPERLPAAHSWIWWAAQDFVSQKSPPQVVILGSSLLMNPIQEQDATFLNKEIDSVVNHRSAYLEAQLKKDLHDLGGPHKIEVKNAADLDCFNFAVPGSLMSDNYMVLRTLLTGARKPQVVVLGLALRDFIDNQVPCAAATPTFKYLSRYTDISDLVDLTMPNVWQRGEYWIDRRLYLVGKKLEVQSALSSALEANADGGNSSKISCNTDTTKALFPVENCRLNAFDMSCYVPGFKSEVERNVWITKPVISRKDSKNGDVRAFQDNSAEYRRRYRSPNKELFACQKSFLEKFCQLAQEAKISVIIVNMPVTAEHVALMPAGSYTEYMQTLASASLRYNASLRDLNSCGKFSDSDFSDTCHMQASGGKKLLDLVSLEIAQNPEMARSIGFASGARSTVRSAFRTGVSKLATFGRTIY